jgi:hypothetical protein
MDRANVIEQKSYQSQWYNTSFAMTPILNNLDTYGSKTRVPMRNYTGPQFWFDRVDSSISRTNMYPFRYHFPGGMEHPTGAQRDLYGLLDSSPKPTEGFINQYVGSTSTHFARQGFPGT